MIKEKVVLLLLIISLGITKTFADNISLRIKYRRADKNTNRHTQRAPAIVPINVNQVGENIIFTSYVEIAQDCCVVISDMNGVEVKNETVTIVSGQDTLLYIGDLSEGTYELTIETDDYTLYGTFEVE